MREEVPIVNKPRRACLFMPPAPKGVLRELFIIQSSFLPMDIEVERCLDNYFIRTNAPLSSYRKRKCGYALISTSTPEGRSSFERASTVLEEEV